MRYSPPSPDGRQPMSSFFRLGLEELFSPESTFPFVPFSVRRSLGASARTVGPILEERRFFPPLGPEANKRQGPFLKMARVTNTFLSVDPPLSRCQRFSPCTQRKSFPIISSVLWWSHVPLQPSEPGDLSLEDSPMGRGPRHLLFDSFHCS